MKKNTFSGSCLKLFNLMLFSCRFKFCQPTKARSGWKVSTLENICLIEKMLFVKQPDKKVI